MTAPEPAMLAALLLAVGPADPPAPRQPLVRVLREKWAYDDPAQTSEFFRALARLLPADPDPQAGGFLTYRSARGGLARLSRGRAVPVGPPPDGLTAVVLGAGGYGGSKVGATLLVLLDPDGKELDRVAVGINGRYGSLTAETSRTEPTDGAQLVVRFVSGGTAGDNTWHNWHTVTRDGKDYTFRCQERDEPVDWLGRGLLRLAVRDGKFRVLFPKLADPDPPAGK